MIFCIGFMFVFLNKNILDQPSLGFSVFGLLMPWNCLLVFDFWICMFLLSLIVFISSFLLFNICSVCDKQLYVNIFKTSLHISTHIVEIKKKKTQLRKNSNRWHSCSRRNIMFIGNRLHLLYLVVNRLLVLHQILDIRKYKMVISNISHFKTIRKPIKTCENPLKIAFVLRLVSEKYQS